MLAVFWEFKLKLKIKQDINFSEFRRSNGTQKINFFKKSF